MFWGQTVAVQHQGTRCEEVHLAEEGHIRLYVYIYTYINYKPTPTQHPGTRPTQDNNMLEQDTEDEGNNEQVMDRWGAH